ncbi:MAG: heparinase [Bacteroidetes bacterium GWF2_42_66]|nr:MAG: heparinase [Bacteroidetes bacterium GWA2_42_15]OFX99757.1 MAG: heparinase [Bacteroidetes bacterium GWE2_42_39]OFY39795.1 MAG: heparinase [Bacteroidetes bacterium GWF2_42_66]HBL74828.1 heparinase [Prolixibacteraceae bacterium]HCU61070.1 heparinase [Prolixibacteraceae bacterium]
MKKIIPILVLFLVCKMLFSQDQNLLSGKYSIEELGKILIASEKWVPFPKINDRQAWSKADQEMMKAYFEEAQKLLTYQWPTLPATTTLLFVRNGNRSEYQRLSSPKRSALAALLLGEIYENKGRFIDHIINGVWSICEESYWGVPAHLGQWHAGSGLPDVSDPYVDLFAAETATFLSWVDYFLGEKLDTVSPQIRKRIYYEINKRIFAPVMTFDHGWMGLDRNGERRPNNWNPWICSNWLNAALLLEKDDARRTEMVAKILKVLDEFINPYPADGGCDEGPGYWHVAGASVFDNISMLNLATNNAFDYAFRDEKIRNMGRFIYRTQISEKYVLNFADASPKSNMSGYLIWRFGKAIDDKDMQGFGAWFQGNFNGKAPSGQFFRTLFDLFEKEEFSKAPRFLPLPKEVWLPDLQVMVARDKQGSTDGFFVGAKGGNNDESHNHNDVGNYVVYYNGFPLIIDVGSGTYTAKTFSPRRYEIWSNRSDYHNLPTINGFSQKEGPQYKAAQVSFTSNSSFAQLSLNLAKAYPAEAGIIGLERTIRLNRGKNVEITDLVNLSNPGSIVQHLMTCYPSEVVKPGELLVHFNSEENQTMDFIIRYNPVQLNVEVEKIKLETPEDGGIRRNWGETIHRINFTSKDSKTNSKFVFNISKK